MPARVARLSSPIEGSALRERRLDLRASVISSQRQMMRVVRRELEIEARRRIETPERVLEASMARKRTACAHAAWRRRCRHGRDRRRRRDRRSLLPPARRCAPPRPVQSPMRVDTRPRWSGRQCRGRDELMLALVEDMAAAERAKDLVRGLEAIAQADGVDLEDLGVRRRAADRSRHSADKPVRVFSTRGDGRAVDHRHCGEPRAVSQAVEHEPRRGGEHAQERGHGSFQRDRRELDHGGDAGAARRELARDLEVQRTVAGDRARACRRAAGSCATAFAPRPSS